MPNSIVPFDLTVVDEVATEDLLESELFYELQPELQEAAEEDHHLLRYLHTLPYDVIGYPEYVDKLQRGMREQGRRNVIYPVGGGIYIHLFPDFDETRDWYVAIEPVMSLDISAIMAEMERRLIDFVERLAQAESDDERREALLEAVEEICQIDNSAEGEGRLKGRKLRVTEEEFRALQYMLVREKVGLGPLEPLIRDPNIEDISCAGAGPIFVEHKMFRALKTSINFQETEDLDDFVVRLAERIKKPVTFRRPVVDATLPDGSRINVVFGSDVSKRGSNFTIRKFAETPLSILELIGFGSCTYHIAAYLSMIIDGGMSIFVSGETASGKTTLLNGLTVFIPPSAKIVSIEDTPELQVPHPNWVREVVRGAGQGTDSPGVGMFDLLKAALRQRPNEIMVGEIRGEEGAVAFQAMQTGHPVMSTFHAATVEKLIQRLTGEPINIPKAYVDNLNVAVIQSAVHLPDGRIARRVMSVNEIVGYDPPSDTFSFIEVFRWDAAKDIFEFIGNRNSYLLETRLAPIRGYPENERRKIYDDLEKRVRVLRMLHEQGITNFHDLYRTLAKLQRDGQF